MSDLNIVTLTGRLVRDPDVRRGDSGNLWGVFTLASNYHYKDKGGAFQEEAAFVDCKTFGRWAESLAKRKKGDMALVAGRLKTDSWEKDGRKQYKLTVICDSVRFFVPQNGSSTHTSVAENEPAMQEALNDKNGKLPF
jgi:single-strand DNA-binding protein